MTCGVYDHEKVVHTPVRSCGSTRIERGARSSVKNGHPVIMCEVLLVAPRNQMLALPLRIRNHPRTLNQERLHRD
jgi:hypothetical protein